MSILTRTAINIKAISKDKGYPEFLYDTVHLVANEDFKKEEVSGIVGSRKYSPTAGDKIYLSPGCNIPRFKIKQFCETHKVAIVKYREKATAIFIGPESINNLFHYTGGTRTTTKAELLKFLDKVVGSSDPRYTPFIEAVRKSEHDTVFLDYDPYRDLYGKTHFGIQLPMSYETIPLHLESEKDLKAFVDYSTDPRVFNQDDILKMLNTGGIMDLEMYESIKRLFQSSDIQNTKLAMESMANCDYEKSAVPLLLLVREFNKKIEESNVKHHVNFKSMLKFFNIDGRYGLSIDEIITSLKSKKLLSPSNLQLLMPEAMKQMLENADLQHFTVKQIDVSDEIKEAMKENILEPVDGEIIMSSGEEEEIKPNFVPSETH